MPEEIAISRYVPCPSCADGACGTCGPASAEQAAPGVQLAIQHVRFVRCECAQSATPGCAFCGPNHHRFAAPGVRLQVVASHVAKAWVPAIHWAVKDRGATKSSCGTSCPEKRLATDPEAVTCKLCRKTPEYQKAAKRTA